MTSDEIIDGILEREGEGTPPYTTPGDHGGRTRWGISERAHPEAWRAGPPSEDQARKIYEAEYVRPFLGVKNDPLRNQLVDIAVLHGMSTAWHLFSLVVPFLTFDSINRTSAQTQNLVNNALVGARVGYMLSLNQRQFEHGWVRRATSFLE
jgi:lysozyme family protein